MKKIITLLVLLGIFSNVYGEGHRPLNDKSDVNDFDAFFMQHYSKNLNTMADVATVCQVLSPCLIFLGTDKSQHFPLVLTYSETLLATYGVSALCKNYINRDRPYTYFEEGYSDAYNSKEYNSSFFSDHTSIAFASASFTTYMFSKYYPYSKWKPVVGISSYGLATGVALLRVLGGSHFMTDAITGACVGTCLGILVPFLNIQAGKHFNFSPVGVNVSFQL